MTSCTKTIEKYKHSQMLICNESMSTYNVMTKKINLYIKWNINKQTTTQVALLHVPWICPLIKHIRANLFRSVFFFCLLLFFMHVVVCCCCGDERTRSNFALTPLGYHFNFISFTFFGKVVWRALISARCELYMCVNWVKESRANWILMIAINKNFKFFTLKIKKFQL